MVPCPWYNEMADWYKENPDYDLGLHLAMNSEWKWYRWGPVAGRDKVPGMVDKDGFLWRSRARNGPARQAGGIEAEIRAKSSGPSPRAPGPATSTRTWARSTCGSTSPRPI